MVSKPPIRQGSHLKNLTFLWYGLEKTVTADMAVDLQVSLGEKHALSQNLEKSCNLSLHVDIEKPLRDLAKIGENSEIP